ncbi:MAG: polysaccharide biosynthesis protein [Bacilli bacterium]|jgi:O-antigen/teichoic acid export membrane protein
MKKSNLIQGALIATICIVITKILGIIYVIPFYSIIGTQGGVLYGYAYSIYGIFLTLSSVGIPLAISRLISEYNSLHQYDLKQRAFSIGKKVITVLSVMSFLALFVFAPNIAELFIGNIQGSNTKEDIAFVIRIISTAILIVPQLSVTKGYLQGHKFISVSSFSQVLEQLFRIIIIILGSYITIKVLNLPITVGVGVATSGATIGGIMAYLYIKRQMHKHENDFNEGDQEKSPISKISDMSIAKRILQYSVAYIFGTLALSFYDLIDLSTIIKTMVNGLAYGVGEAETVLSIFATWGSKLNMIIAAIATGLLTSLIPNITTNFVNGELVAVRHKINRSLQLLLYFTIPMTIGLSLLSVPIWTTFYKYDLLSSGIFKYYIFIALLSSTLLTFNAILQSLDFRKSMFINILVGLIAKLFLNIPLMYMFTWLNLHAAYGAITATIVGFTISILLNAICLKRKIGVDYRETFRTIARVIAISIVMILVVMLLQYLIPIDVSSKMNAFKAIALYGLAGSTSYFILSYKIGLVQTIFGDNAVHKILKKLRIAKE